MYTFPSLEINTYSAHLQQLVQPKAPPPSPVVFGLESTTMVPPSPILRGPMSGGIATTMPTYADHYNMYHELSMSTCDSPSGPKGFASHQLMQPPKPMAAPSRALPNAAAATLRGACAALLRGMPHANRSKSYGDYGSNNSSATDQSD